MIAWHLTDLHLDCGKFQIKKEDYPEADVLIMTGDMNRKLEAWTVVKEALDEGYIVIYILGNHCHQCLNSRNVYSMSEIEAMWEKKAKENENFFFLNNSSVIIDGVKFIGTTLWTDFNDKDNETLEKFKDLSDANKIYKEVKKSGYSRRGGKNITAEDVLNFHKKAKEYLVSELEKDFDGIVVVATHHAPSFKSIPKEYNNEKNRKMNGLWASNLEYLFFDYKIDFWFHGHCHTSLNYFINKGNVICNARGNVSYNEVNPKFNPKLTIKLKPSI